MGRAGEKGLVLVTYLLSQFLKLPCSTLLWTSRDEESQAEELVITKIQMLSQVGRSRYTCKLLVLGSVFPGAE